MSSKALVIKGVNFATNKVATVSFGEDKHCTGISLSSNALTFTTLVPQTLTATVTPNDTTDAVSWASSDTSVATVTNGVVTVVGIGTATITATCGTQSATCSVTASAITLNLNDDTVYGATNTGHITKNASRDYLGFSDTIVARTYYMLTNGFTYAAISKEGELYAAMYGIPVLSGATKITATFPKAFNSDPRLGLIDGNTQTTYNLSPATIKRAKAYNMLSSASTLSGDTRTIEFDISEEDSAVNAFVLSIYNSTTTDASGITGDVTVTFT